MAEGWHPTRGTGTSVAGYVTPTFHERLCVYVHPPFTHEVRPRAGRWIGVSAWPPTDGSAGPIKCATFRLSAGDNGLVRCTRDSHDDAVWGVWGAEGDHAASAVDGVSVRSEWATRVISTDTCMAGGHGGEWLSYGGPDLAGDQRMDDAQCLTWDSPPLDADYAVRSTGSRRVVVCGRCDQSPCRVCHDAPCAFQIVGFPVLRCIVRSSQPVAQLAVRLCQVFPDGTSAQVTRGLLNLTHRHGHGTDAVAAMPVDTPCAVTVRLNAVAHTVPTGCRIRVAVSPL